MNPHSHLSALDQHLATGPTPQPLLAGTPSAILVQASLCSFQADRWHSLEQYRARPHLAHKSLPARWSHPTLSRVAGIRPRDVSEVRLEARVSMVQLRERAHAREKKLDRERERGGEGWKETGRRYTASCPAPEPRKRYVWPPCIRHSLPRRLKTFPRSSALECRFSR